MPDPFSKTELELVKKLCPVISWEHDTFAVRAGTSWLAFERNGINLFRFRGEQELGQLFVALQRAIHQNQSGELTINPDSGCNLLVGTGDLTGQTTRKVKLGLTQGEKGLVKIAIDSRRFIIHSNDLADIGAWLGQLLGHSTADHFKNDGDGVTIVPSGSNFKLTIATPDGKSTSHTLDTSMVRALQDSFLTVAGTVGASARVDIGNDRYLELLRGTVLVSPRISPRLRFMTRAGLQLQQVALSRRELINVALRLAAVLDV